MSCRHFAGLVLFVVLLILLPLQGDCRIRRMHKNVGAVAVAVPSTLVVGTLYCDDSTCSESESESESHQDQHMMVTNKQGLGHFIPGASVEVACKLDDHSKKHTTAANFHTTAITDTKGSFQFNIPLPPSSIKINCTFGLLKISQPTLCHDAVPASASASAAKDIHAIKVVYSAGTVTLKPQKRPAACHQHQQIIDHPAFFFLPPNPLQPPNIVGIPLPQNPLVPPPMSLLPPGLQPAPPSLIPPGLPLLPSPPPSRNLLPPLPILEPPPSSSPPALPILPPGLPLVPPGLPLVPPGLPLVPPGLPLIPPGLPLIPPGLPIPPSSALEKKDAP